MTKNIFKHPVEPVLNVGWQSNLSLTFIAFSASNSEFYWQLINLLTRSSLLTSSGVTGIIWEPRACLQLHQGHVSSHQIAAQSSQSKYRMNEYGSSGAKGTVRIALSFELGLKVNSIIFWDMTPCSPLSVNRRFRRTYRLQLITCTLVSCWT
jgi:hypothetical protein